MIIEATCNSCGRRFQNVILSFGSPGKRPMLKPIAMCQKCRQAPRKSKVKK